ncbi:MAG: SpoIIIAH-like family protein [Clostridia bacterium]|nr:SpoIIIAH-like family protein [Clostridia bacterium]
MKNRFKSMVLTFLAIFFIGVGFFSFNVSEDSFDIGYTENKEKTGDVELVNSEPVEENIDGLVPNEENTFEEVVSENETDYFSESRLERDKMYSQLIETYQKMIESREISTEQKGIAIEEINRIANQKNGILIAENLIKNKGFEDVVIFANDESISVVVRSNITLSKEQIAQIQNIVSRELVVKVENINISNK